MTDLATIIKENIIKSRKASGLSQQQIADKTGLKRSTIGNIERGTQRPTVDFLVAFSEIVDVSVDEVLGIRKQVSKDQGISNDTFELLMRKLAECDDLESVKTYSKELIEYTSKILKEKDSLKEELETLKTDTIKLLLQLKK